MDQGASDVKVLVVGAGVAGLSAAEHLLKHGFPNVTVLEAADRIGGRAHTVNFGPRETDIVEKGANWIHGGCGANSFFNLANSLGMLNKDLVHLERMEGFCYCTNGRVIETDLVDKIFNLFCTWEGEKPELSYYSNRPSIIEHLRHQLHKTLIGFRKEDHEDVKCVFNCLINLCQFHNGGYIGQCPIYDIDGYVDLPGGNIKVPCGMSAILNTLIRIVPIKSIQKNKEVVRIKMDEFQVHVTCKDGSLYRADHVICTQSLGCLKATAHTLFEPELPSVKMTAIQTIPFGKVNKIFLYYEKPFWVKGCGGIKFCWTDSEAKITSSTQWYKKIFAFDEVHDNPNVLVGWISGEEAMHMETVSESVIIDVCTELIRLFLKDPSIPAPTKILKTQWCSNKYTLGSYSYRNYFSEIKHTSDYMEPVKHGQCPTILFAGEATSMTSYSTLHGARSSGLREAERLIDYYGKKIQESFIEKTLWEEYRYQTVGVDQL